MSQSRDLLFQNLSTVQSEQQPTPTTIASAASIAPNTFMTLVTGTVDVATFVPPIAGQHMLVVVFTNASPGDILTTGNVLVGTTTVVQNVPVLLFWNPIAQKYYVK
jgi:hypothetical protein